MNRNYEAFGLLAVTIAALGAIPSVSDEFFQNLLVIIALLSLLLFVWAFHGCPCKERLTSAWNVCKRCLGFYIGIAISVIVALILSLTNCIPILSRPFALIFLLLSFACNLPTMIHGGKRRLKGNQDLDDSGFLMLSGFLAGIGWILCFLALNALLN